jgi:hypothetical protein
MGPNWREKQRHAPDGCRFSVRGAVEWLVRSNFASFPSSICSGSILVLEHRYSRQVVHGVARNTGAALPCVGLFVGIPTN